MPSRLAVIVAAYNAENTLRQAVESVLSGAMSYDVFIVDDCSRTPVSDVLSPYDGVEIIRLKRNRGPAVARNIGLSKILAKDYDYVAIMDADDVSKPDRLAKQVLFLDKNPRVGAVGCGARFFDEITSATTKSAQRGRSASVSG